MNYLEWIKIAIAILSGLAAAIPLVVKLVQVLKNWTKEKNWAKIVEMVLALMAEAEELFSEGEAKKAWVMERIRIAAQKVDYNYDAIAEQKISEMIDAICEAAKVINT